MSEEMVSHLANDMTQIKNTLKWGIILLTTILLSFAGVIGGNTLRSVKNKKDVDRYEIAIKEMVTKQQMARLIEFSKIRKELIIVTLSGRSSEEVDLLWDRLDDLERMVIEDDYGFYFRGTYEDKDD